MGPLLLGRCNMLLQTRVFGVGHIFGWGFGALLELFVRGRLVAGIRSILRRRVRDRRLLQLSAGSAGLCILARLDVCRLVLGAGPLAIVCHDSSTPARGRREVRCWSCSLLGQLGLATWTCLDEVGAIAESLGRRCGSQQPVNGEMTPRARCSSRGGPVGAVSMSRSRGQQRVLAEDGEERTKVWSAGRRMGMRSSVAVVDAGGGFGCPISDMANLAGSSGAPGFRDGRLAWEQQSLAGGGGRPEQA